MSENVRITQQFLVPQQYQTKFFAGLNRLCLQVGAQMIGGETMAEQKPVVKDSIMTLDEDMAEETERATEARAVIEGIRGCVDSDWSIQTVDGIEQFIIKHGLATANQLQALKNIREKCHEES